MATCEYGQEWLLEALDGLVTGEQRRAWDRHLAGCAVCQRDWRTLGSTQMLLHHPMWIAAPVGFSQAVMGRLQPRVIRASRRRGVTLLAGSLAALLVFWLPLLMGAALVYIGLTQQPAWMAPAQPFLRQSLVIAQAVLDAVAVLLRGVAQAVLDEPMALSWAAILAALLGGWMYGLRQFNLVRANQVEG